MPEVSSWSELGRWTWALVRRGMPQRLLAWAWRDKDVLLSIHAVHFEQWPRFNVHHDREPPELDLIGFNLFNFTPFKLSVVGVDLRISVDSREWMTQSQRLPSEVLVPAFGRGGYYFKMSLSGSQAKRLREHEQDWVQVRIGGHLVLKSTLGELKKEIHSDVVAIIDR